MLTDPVVIASYARTPMGGFQGVLADATAPELGAVAVKAAVERAGVSPDAIERAKPEKIPSLKPAFVKDGTVTPANSSSISEGATALVMTRQSVAEKLGLPIVAKVVATAAHAQEPAKFTSAPAWLKALSADPAKLNVNGGAIALGHPLGASGTKLMATLVHVLRARGLRWDLQTMCEGGGIANITILEVL